MVDAPTGLRNKINPFFARVNHVKLARVDKNKTEFLGTIGGAPTMPPAPIIADIPYDGVFTPGIITADVVSGFDTNTGVGTPVVPDVTFSNGQLPTRNWLQANQSTGRIDLQALSGVDDFRMGNAEGLLLDGISMQFDDEAPFSMGFSGGLRYRNNAVVAAATYLFSKAETSTPVRLRMEQLVAAIIGPYEVDGIEFFVRTIDWAIGFNIDNDPPADIWLTPQELEEAGIEPNQKLAMKQRLIENGWDDTDG